MSLSALGTVDFTAPYWRAWQSLLSDLPTYALDQTELIAHLNQHKPSTLSQQFIAQECLPLGMAYEWFIFKENKIPTRAGLHDFFNALCWFYFPQTKQRFNQLHHEQILSLGTQQRGRVRDYLTVLDENGLFIQAPDPLWQALVDKQWFHAFVELRELWSQSRVMVFGHALLEKLVHPYKAITAHAVRIPDGVLPPIKPTADGSVATFSTQHIGLMDDYLAQWFTVSRLQHKPYIPVQIFGIPGWSEAQQDTDFYADQKVFRPSNMRSGTKLSTT